MGKYFTNTLAYYNIDIITVVKGFIEQAPRMIIKSKPKEGPTLAFHQNLIKLLKIIRIKIF